VVGIGADLLAREELPVQVATNRRFVALFWTRIQSHETIAQLLLGQRRVLGQQVQQELAVQLDKFEKEVQRGTYLDGNITLNEFADKWMKDYAETNLKATTLARYKKLMERILIALGHKKLDSIQPTHLIEFYKNLGEAGIRDDYKYKLKEGIIINIT